MLLILLHLHKKTNIMLRWFVGESLKYEVIDDLCYTLIVTRTLGHILCQILVAKIPISHRGIRAPELLILSSAL